MQEKKFNSSIVKMLVAVFCIVIILSGMIIKVNLSSVDSVHKKTDSLINTHIHELQDIADLQNLVSSLVINLHQYYANFDNKYFDINQKQITSIRAFISKNNDFFASDIKKEILSNLSLFEQHSDEFHKEMSKTSGRDWDKLRQHLYDSEENSNKIINLLNKINEKIRDSVRNNSIDTLSEIKTLNNYQIILILVMSVVLLYVFFVLYGRVEDQEKLFKLAYFDRSTGLPNQTSFTEKILMEISDSKKPDNSALILLSFDRYELVTGRYGSLIAENLIKQVSNWLENEIQTQASDFEIFKFTTTSWLIHKVNYTHESDVIDLAEQLLSISNDEIFVDDIEIACGFSIGIAFDKDHQKKQDDLIREADAAMNVSRDDGGNSFQIYSEVMGDEIKQYVDIDQALRHAIDEEEFLLYFQPKIDARTGDISSSEVLLRWISNGRMIGPNIFIPIAEKSGLIIRIGNWVLEQACKQWVIWQKQGLNPLPIAVNISAVQFQDPNFPNLVRSILSKTCMPPYMLELEITEEAAAAKPEEIIRIMQKLKDTGVTLAIDDFGTGYSSLSYLKRFPLDVLKIDQSFIRDMENSESDSSIVKLIVDLAKKLNFHIVAEGVETEQQYIQLKEWGCDCMQGYYFSKPLKVNEFTSILQNIELQEMKKLVPSCCSS